MRAALQLPVEKLEQMGRVGAERVAQRHNAAIEGGKLAALFQSNVEKSKGQAIDLFRNKSKLHTEWLQEQRL
jgi:hypothetical protein